MFGNIEAHIGYVQENEKNEKVSRNNLTSVDANNPYPEMTSSANFEICDTTQLR